MRREEALGTPQRRYSAPKRGRVQRVALLDALRISVVQPLVSQPLGRVQELCSSATNAAAMSYGKGCLLPAIPPSPSRARDCLLLPCCDAAAVQARLILCSCSPNPFW